MGLSLVTLAIAKKQAKEAIDSAVSEALVAAKQYTDSRTGEVISFEVEIVDSLPSVTGANPHIIYFVPRSTLSEETDFYYEYMVVNNKWEIIGSTKLDLSNYWTIDDIKDYIQSKEYILPKATTNTLGGVIVDGITIDVDNNGKISVIESKTQELIDENFSSITEGQIQNLFN